MDIVLQCLLENEFELRTLRTVTIVVLSFVAYLAHGIAEHPLGSLNLAGNLRQISDFQRCTIFFDNVHHVDVIDNQGSVFNPELVLRKIEGLSDQVDVFVLHPLKQNAKVFG